jgi:hypothetical protein
VKEEESERNKKANQAESNQFESSKHLEADFGENKEIQNLLEEYHGDGGMVIQECADCTGSSVALSKISSPSSEDGGSSEWTCQNCTFCNRKRFRKCEVCFEFNPVFLKKTGKEIVREKPSGIQASPRKRKGVIEDFFETKKMKKE